MRAQGKIRDAGIPYQVPSPAELPERLDARAAGDLSGLQRGLRRVVGRIADPRTICPAKRSASGRLLVELLPEPEAIGLLALMLLQESRRERAHVADGE